MDDEPALRDLMARWAASVGLQPRIAADAETALQSLNERHADLAVIDIMMPGKNGLWLAGEIRRDHPNTAVVLATGYTEFAEQAASDGPVADFLVKPFKRDRFVLAVDRGRQWRRQAIEELEWHGRLTQQLQDRVEDVRALLAQERSLGHDERVTLLTLTEDRTPDVLAHSERVAQSSVAVARAMGVDDESCALIECAARFHDVGKVAIPEALLTKPSALTPVEIAIMRRHVDAGAAILEATDPKGLLWAVAGIVRTSHEWFGGGGYPQKLAGATIPLPSRIIAVVDAYDAMTDERSYRKSMASADAISELLRSVPSQFDPTVVVAFLTLLENGQLRLSPAPDRTGRPEAPRVSGPPSIH